MTMNVIVVVDDVGTLASATRASLEEAGYDVHDSKGGVAGLQLCSQVKPDIVISHLTGIQIDIDNLWLLAQLRERAPRTPVITASAAREPEVGDAMKVAGAVEHVQAPFDGQRFAMLVDKLIGS